MEKIKTKKSKIKRKKAKNGQISIRNKKNGKEARTTLQLNIKGVPNPRLSRYGETEEIARRRLAEAILLTYIEAQKNNRLSNMQIFSPECQEELEKFDEYMECLKKKQMQSTLKKKNEQANENSINMFVMKMLNIKKKQSEKQGTHKRKQLSPKTVTFYKGVAEGKVIPIFGEMDVTTITQEEIEDKLETLDCSTKYLKDIKLVLKLSFDVAIKEKLRKDNPAEKIRIYNDKKSLGIEIEHLEQDRQEIWLSIFENDKRMASYLYETILLTGARPEEGCGFKWNAMDFDKDIVRINNAYKDWEIYNDNMEKLGHKRGDGDLKTLESYRDIPMHPRLKRLLLMIKSERMEEYKKIKKKWNDNSYIFLNQNKEPFVPQDLSRKMPYFIRKYNLEHLTVYGLRHSFATLCSTLGMPPEVLHVIMGHSDFETTRKYYIHITGERKKNEMMKLYIKQNGEETLKQLINESDMYFRKIKQLKVQDIKIVERIAS